MQIEEAIKKIKGKNIFSSEKTETGYDYMENINEVVNILLIYVETMHKEFDRLEGIEDNTAMLKYELEKKDKVIDEMAKYINNEESGNIYELTCTRECENEKCKMSIEDNELQEIKCIKEYFYKRVGEENDAIRR